MFSYEHVKIKKFLTYILDNWRFLCSLRNNTERSHMTYTQYPPMVQICIFIAQCPNRKLTLYNPLTLFPYHQFYVHLLMCVLVLCDCMTCVAPCDHRQDAEHSKYRTSIPHATFFIVSPQPLRTTNLVCLYHFVILKILYIPDLVA